MDDIEEDHIAIIGMAGRFPGANNIDEFWENLKNGVESITFFSDEELLSAGIEPTVFNQPNYVKAKGVLDDVAGFDAAFFGFTPKEAEITDPQQRLFLECAWEALENAGYDPKTYSGDIGVYGGIGGFDTYLSKNILTNPDIIETVGTYQATLSNDKDFLCTRTAYKLNLSGPAITMQTGCSTSLVAVIMGCQSLAHYQCDMVLAGGATITMPTKAGYLYQDGMIMSPDGFCRTFDAKAQGTVGGNGAGIVVLKRLEDALTDGDHIYAVIRGSHINNDGTTKINYTAPSVEGQAKVIKEALAIADVAPETITYVEAHGTGTPLGDPIEIAALTQAFGTEHRNYCGLGSVKTNVGHLDVAAGVTGLIKVALALKHQLIPPSLHFESPNPKIDFANSPFYVNTQLRDWQTDGFPRRAGVSAFGIGGTNAHVVLEEAPLEAHSEKSRAWQLLVLSAKTATALETATSQLVAHLKQHPDLNLVDVAYTYQVGRQAFNHRRMLVCKTLEGAVATFSSPSQGDFKPLTHIAELKKTPEVVFMFSGQGSQYVNMALELYQTESIFRTQIDYCAEFLKPHLNLDLRTVKYPDSYQENDTQPINQTALSQPALFVIEYALAQLWMSWGIKPAAMIGHSIGEYVAACLAGVLTLDEALVLVAARGRLMQTLPSGTMLAVPLPEEEIRPLLNNNIDLAVINVPSQSVVSGPTEAVEQFATQLLAERGLECKYLHTSHAFHSAMMSPILPAFLEQVQKVQLQPPKMPYLSNVTGTWIKVTEATDPNYWVKHLRQTVRFADGLQPLVTKSKYILLEVGPGRTLSTFAKRYPEKVAGQVILTSLRHPKDEQSDSGFLLNTLGQLWLAGVVVNWTKFYGEEQRLRLPLPSYPFERRRYWVESPNISQSTQIESLPTEPKKVESPVVQSRRLLENYAAPQDELEQTIADIWAKHFGLEKVGIYDEFFELGGDSLLAVKLTSQLRDALQVDLAPHHLIEASTIIQLVSLIQEMRLSPRNKTPSILVEIQRGNPSNLPLFCIHPAGGNIFHYRNLSRYLGSEQPIYGIRSPEAFEAQQEFSNLADRATHYIDVIRTVQSKGPYLLAGMSFGGNMAFEMAIQFQKQGEEIALVAMFDSFPPTSYKVQFEDDSSFLGPFLIMAELLLGNKYDLQDVSVDELQKLNINEQWDYVLKRVNDLVPDMENQEAIRLFHIWKSHHSVLKNHTLQFFSALLIFFQAIELMPDAIISSLNIEVDKEFVAKEWRKFAPEMVHIKVPGNHFTILEEPNLPVLAKHLNAAINNQSFLPTKPL
jgi:acyl transferase domain-containing protein/thioesterase domain-containing protein